MFVWGLVLGVFIGSFIAVPLLCFFRMASESDKKCEGNVMDKYYMERSKSAAVLYYNNTPISFSEYAYYHIGSGYIALHEPSDNACVLCRVLSEKEIPIFEGVKYKLVLSERTKSQETICVVIIKRDLHNLKEVSKIMEKYTTIKNAYQYMKVFEY